MPLTRARRALAAACLALPGLAHAACTVSSSGIAFGTYNPFKTTPTDATGTVTLTCSAGSGSGAYGVGLTVGGGASYTARRMISGSQSMAYQVYTDAARSTVWGDGSAGTTYGNANDNRPQTGGTTTLTVYGRVAARLAVAPGSYTDTLMVVVVY